MKRIDDIIWDIFEKDQINQGFIINGEKISLTLAELKKSRARGGFTVGQLVHKSADENWQALTFDDITGAPYRALDSRDNADISTYLTRNIKLEMPLISSNMECVTGFDMAVAMSLMGGAGILHQYGTIDEQVDTVKKVKLVNIEKINIDGKEYSPSLDSDKRLIVGAATGVQEKNIERAKALVNAGVDFLVIDIAHGHSDQMISQIRQLKELYPSLDIIAGNVVTPKGAYELCEAGASALKVGVGPGAACTTRIVTGYGIPQITAIYETSIIAKEYGVKIMADGGIKASGDMVKALASGADTIMLGGLLAQTDLSNDFEQRIIQKDKNGTPLSVKYYGSASEESKKKQGRGAYDAPEGRTRALPFDGNTYDALAKYITGIRSGISYAGRSRDIERAESANINRLREKSRWIIQTPSGIYEANKGNGDPKGKI